MASTLSVISIIAYISAGVLLVLAIILAIVFRIPSVIGDLSGRNAKKSIEQMRANNVRTGNKSYRPTKTNLERGKLTGSMPDTEGKIRGYENLEETGVLDENRATSYSEAETTSLTAMDSTEALDSEENTMPLVGNQNIQNGRTEAVRITILDEIMLVHTNEEITWSQG